MNQKFVFVAILSFAALAYSQGQDFCIRCTSSVSHPECNDPITNNINGTLCPQGSGGEECYVLVRDDGSVERDCIGNLGADLRNNCNTETCGICRGVNCNSGLFPLNRLSCHTCTGAPGSNCSGVLTDVNPVVCPVFRGEDTCFISRRDGNYERGCRSSLSSARCIEGQEPCHFCSGNGCNSIDFNSAFSISSGAKLLALVAFIVLTIFK